jgi:RPA family protein
MFSDTSAKGFFNPRQHQYQKSYDQSRD